MNPGAGRHEPAARGPLGYLHIDLEPERPPSLGRWLLAAALALGGSILADVALVSIGKFVFPTVMHCVDFRPSCYSTLTAIGVALGCLTWPAVARISSTPRWLYLRLSIVLLLALGFFDAYLVGHGSAKRVVAVLLAMQIAAVVITYNALVRLAPTRRRSTST